ncbi:hypothetical protein [Massilia sp. TSP1-1-2]|uniref:hypothetical protein n=1 Tax=Massilia sp. TSP1-1-2 TaxID=2804649 RepID=UPI003CEDA75B
MNAFAHFAAQHEALLNHQRTGGTRKQTRPGARPDTPTEVAVHEHIMAHPDVDAGGIAAALSIETELLYPIMQRLRRNGQIFSTGKVGNGNKWRAVA